MSQTTDQELQQEIQQKVIQKLNQLLNYGDSPVFVLNTLQDVQQNFINTFDSADDELLKDGTLILSELNKILTELAFNQK